MSFDIDPQDIERRILCYHPESDCYFICKSLAEFANYNKDEQIDDVTGSEKHEAEHKERLKGEQR